MMLENRLSGSFKTFASRPALSMCIPPRPLVTLTYRELGTATEQISRELDQMGYRPGDVVLCYMAKSMGLVATLLSVMGSGGVACCLNNKLKPQQVLRMAGRAGARFLALEQGSLEAFRRAQRGAAVESEWDFIPEYTRSVSLPTGEASASNLHLLKLAPRHVDFAGFSSGGSAPKESPAFCLFTSGSTGTQKGVLISGTDLVERTITEADYFSLGEGDVLLSLLPFSFDVGLNQLLSCYFSGGHLVMMNSWFPKDIRTAIADCSITGISGVPFLWVEMMSAYPDGFLPKAARVLRYITVSGGDLAPVQLDGLRTNCSGVDIFKTYGQTETFRSGILSPSDFSRKMTSVGLPVRGTQVSVVDESGIPVPPGTEGEIVHYGAGTMVGYLNDPEGTREKLRAAPALRHGTPDGAKAVYTGDRGRIDGDGYLYVHGRQDGMIKTSGQRVYPKEVEDCIQRHPGVNRAAVVGIPDVRKGQSIVAEVVVQGAVRAEEVLAHVRRELPSYMVPDRLRIVASLPVSENGKVRYAEIRGRYEEARVL